MIKIAYKVSSTIMLYITMSAVVHATQCCMHGPLKNRYKQCSTVSNQAECDKKTKAELQGKEIPNTLKPGIGSGTGKCTDDITCCSSSVKAESFSTDIDLAETCSRDRLLVELSNFAATPTDKGILLNWSTKTEFDSQGFRIWRAIPDLNRYCGCSENIEDYTQIQILNAEDKPILIPAKGNIISGSDYSHLDQEAQPGIAYCYALEDINSKGESKFYFKYIAFTQNGLSKETKQSTQNK